MYGSSSVEMFKLLELCNCRSSNGTVQWVEWGDVFLLVLVGLFFGWSLGETNQSAQLEAASKERRIDTRRRFGLGSRETLIEAQASSELTAKRAKQVTKL